MSERIRMTIERQHEGETVDVEVELDGFFEHHRGTDAQTQGCVYEVSDVSAEAAQEVRTPSGIVVFSQYQAIDLTHEEEQEATRLLLADWARARREHESTFTAEFFANLRP